MCCPLWTTGSTAAQLTSDLLIVPRHTPDGVDSSLIVLCRLDCCLLLRLHQYLKAGMPHREKKEEKNIVYFKERNPISRYKAWLN